MNESIIIMGEVIEKIKEAISILSTISADEPLKDVINDFHIRNLEDDITWLAFDMKK